MHQRIYWLIVIMLCSKLPSADAYEYCKVNPPICDEDKPHIICHPEQIKRVGILKGVAPMTDKVKRLLLHEHNKYRNKTACGETKDSQDKFYPNATRMRRLIWDDELAYLAEAHVKRCDLKVDRCRNSWRFSRTGQNLARLRSTLPIDLLSDIPKRILSWYEESKNGVSEEVQNHLETGMFGVMVNDEVSRVGCAISWCFEDNDVDEYEHHYHYCCNYEFNNIHGENPYNYGETGSECSDWGGVSRSDEYKCLCENNGKIFPKFE